MWRFFKETNKAQLNQDKYLAWEQGGSITMIPKKADINDMRPRKNRKQEGAGSNGGGEIKVVKIDLSCVRTPRPLRRHRAALQKWNISCSHCQASVPCVMENQSISYQRPVRRKRDRQVPAAYSPHFFKRLPSRNIPELSASSVTETFSVLVAQCVTAAVLLD